MNNYTDYFADPHAGRPRLDWDNSKWNIYFTALKQKVTPISDSKFRTLPVTRCHLQSGEEYKGETSYQHYCNFINDVLTSIRMGEVDYCYYIYQIADLLRYEPKLKTRLCCEDRLSPYFIVWLPERRDRLLLQRRSVSSSDQRSVNTREEELY